MNKQERDNLIKERRRKTQAFASRIKRNKAKSDERRYAFALKQLKEGKSDYKKKNSDKIANK